MFLVQLTATVVPFAFEVEKKSKRKLNNFKNVYRQKSESDGFLHSKKDFVSHSCQGPTQQNI